MLKDQGKQLYPTIIHQTTSALSAQSAGNKKQKPITLPHEPFRKNKKYSC